MNRRHSTDNDRGGIALIGCLVLITMMGMGAIVLDGGFLAVKRRQIQAVADAAALAGAVALPTSAAAASTEANANLTKNGYTAGTGATVVVTSPYSGSNRQILVTVTKNVSTFLGKALKINTGLVTGRAVATLPAATASVFAGSNNCAGAAAGDSLSIQGTGFNISGDVHSNGSFFVSGTSDSIGGGLEYQSGCAHDNPSPIPVGSGPTSGTAVTPQPYPLSWTTADFPCTYSFANFDVSQPGAWWQANAFGIAGAQGTSAHHAVLRPGTYCSSSGQLQLNGQYVDGTGVTFVAVTGAVQMSGQNMSFTAGAHNTLIFMPQANTNTLQLGSLNWTWTGDIFAPGSLINISGQGFTTSGSIIGNNVALSTGGAGWTMTGGGGPATPYLSE